MNEYIERALKGQSRYEKRKIYRDYYDGKHNTQLSDRQKAYLQIKSGQEFNDNYCPIVIDALAERLNVMGFYVQEPIDVNKIIDEADVPEPGTENESDLQTWRWWQENRMDATQKIVHSAAVRDGDAYNITDWDNENGRPRFTFEPAYDGDEGVEVFYSRERRGQIEYAIKRWATGDEERLNLYFPNRIEKYYRSNTEIKDGADFRKYDGDGKAVEIWTENTKAGGIPLGVPIAHFKNNDQGYSYGRSEIHDVIPPQNALNKAVIDLVAAADTTAFRVFYMLGDDPVALEIIPGSWIYSAKKPGEVEVGHIPGEDLSKLIEFKDAFVTEIARISRTPLSYFQVTGQVRAESSLKQEESGLISRVKNRQVAFGNAWEDAMYMALKLASIYGDAPGYEGMNIETRWSDPETRNDKVFMETLKLKKELGVPLPAIWAEAGYTAAEIKGFIATDEYKQRTALVSFGIEQSQNNQDGQ